jgi:deferrochelatase/peroxidase EfeB
VAGVGIGLGGTGYLIGRDSAEASSHLEATVPFYGPRQAGIETPAQDRLHFAGFDLTISSAAELRDLLREWSGAAAEMTRGEMVGEVNNEQLAPADDTGETVGLRPASLTVTIGLGPEVFERDGRDRFGLRSRSRTRCARSARFPETCSTLSSRAATSASRPARMTRRLRSTRYETLRGSAAAPS